MGSKFNVVPSCLMLCPLGHWPNRPVQGQAIGNHARHNEPLPPRILRLFTEVQERFFDLLPEKEEDEEWDAALTYVYDSDGALA